MGNGEWRTENGVGGECVQIIPKNDVIEGIKKRRSSLTWPESVNRTKERERNKKKRKRCKSATNLKRNNNKHFYTIIIIYEILYSKF